MNFEIDENPEKLIIPLDISKAIYESWDADLVILDKPDQVYGKALHGKGKISFKNQNIYEGEIHNGMMHGNGKFLWANGVEYEGEFKYNAIEGQGVYKWPDQSIYEGQVKASFRDGYGKFTSPNQEAVYEGQWKDGLRQGQGKITFESGAVYEGEFERGYKHGKGKMLYPSGNFYEGEWREDKKCGYGTMKWLSAREKYYGNWSNNLQNGFGVHIWLENKGEGKLLRNRYEGEWKDGERHGHGTFYYANGSKYEGEWKNNLKEGYAVFTEDNGNIVQGLFKADKLVKEKKIAEEQHNNSMQQNKDAHNDSQSDIAGPSESPPKQHSKNEEKGKQGKDAKLKQDKVLQKGATGGVRTNQNSKATLGKTAENGSILQSQQSMNQPKKTKEIEVNPFSYLIDLNDLTKNVEDDIERIHRDTQNMLLRHNTSIKQWYKNYSAKYDNAIGEDAFAMDLQTFWKFMKECKVCDGNMTLTALNRLFYQGAKNDYNMKTEAGEVNKQIDLLKKIGRSISLEELKDLNILNLAIDTSNKLQTTDKFDWNNLDKLQEEEENFDLYGNKSVNIHEGSRVILFRHFVELLVRVSFLKYGNVCELHRSVEKLIEQKLKPSFDKKSSQMANSRPNKSIQSEKSVIISESLSKIWIDTFNDKLQEIYNKISKQNRNAKFGFEDKSITFKQLVKLLEKSGYLNKESNDQQKLILILEKQYDKEQTVGFVEQQHKEEVTNLKKRKNKKGNQTASQSSQLQLSVNYDRLKAEKQTKMFESELMSHEFCEIIIQYLFKFEKDLQTGKDGEINKKLGDILSQILDSATPYSNIKPGSLRKWPSTSKDNAKNQLALQRIKEQKEAEERKKKELEKRRENRERARMQLEDFNIPTDNEEESDEDNY